MRKRLIINADDFGLHSQINQGIKKVLATGIVKSVSFAVNSDAFENSLEILRQFPDVTVGVHLNITDGEPVSGGNCPNFLLDANGFFKGNHLKTIGKVFLNRSQAAGIEGEFDAQIKKALDGGVRIVHLDSHGHIHMLPCLIEIVAGLAKKYQIPFVRIVNERPSFSRELFKQTTLNLLSKLAIAKFRRWDIGYADHFWGLADSGRVTKEKFCAFLRHIPDGVTEIAVHPGADNFILAEWFGWGYGWEEELAVLLSSDIWEEIESQGITLSGFGEAKVLEN